jgi:hypothetical protein
LRVRLPVVAELAIHVYVRLEKDQDGYPPFEAEELDALELGGDRFELLAAPAFAYGLTPGDILRAERRGVDQQPWVVEVLEESDNWLARVMPRSGFGAGDVVELFRSMGCDARDTPFAVVTVVVPSRVAAAAVLEQLSNGQERMDWYYDLGVRPGD